jgi:DNA-binding NarL/FixJ family response regulator
VDDQLMFAEAMAALLERDGMQVVGIAGDGTLGRRLIGELRPDVAVLEVVLPGYGAFPIAAEAARKGLARVLFLSGYVSDIFVAEAVRARAAGYLLKDAPAGVLLDGIRSVHAGEQCFSEAVRARLHYDPERNYYFERTLGGLDSLTSRQVEILRCLAKGRSVKETARSLHLSEKSVDSHKYRIMNALDIHDRVELARFAIREGLTVP